MRGHLKGGGRSRCLERRFADFRLSPARNEAVAKSSESTTYPRMRTISAADANRHFSKLLRDVKAGETLIVTCHGEPVARIVPAASDSAEQEVARRQAARERLLARLDMQPALNLGKFNRDDAYD